METIIGIVGSALMFGAIFVVSALTIGALMVLADKMIARRQEKHSV